MLGGQQLDLWTLQEGSVHKVRVVKLMDYGAFVELPNGFQALLHISELEHERVSPCKPLLVCCYRTIA